MSTAVIYTGQARTFAQLDWNHHWHVLRKLDDPHIYVSVEDDEDAPAMELLRGFPYPVRIERVRQPEVPQPKAREGILGCYPPSSPPQAILRQLWHLQRGWEFMQGFGKTHQVFVRIRPDLAFGRLTVPEVIHPDDCFTPWWARWGGVNDRFAIMGGWAASRYFGTHGLLNTLMDQGCPLHPETLIAAGLDIAPKVRSWSTLDAEFTTIRKDGSVVPMSVTACDIADRRCSP